MALAAFISSYTAACAFVCEEQPTEVRFFQYRVPAPDHQKDGADAEATRLVAPVTPHSGGAGVVIYFPPATAHQRLANSGGKKDKHLPHRPISVDGV